MLVTTRKAIQRPTGQLSEKYNFRNEKRALPAVTGAPPKVNVALYDDWARHHTSLTSSSAGKPILSSAVTKANHPAIRAKADSLLDAIAKGSVARAAYLLREKGADPNAVDEQGDVAKAAYLSKMKVASSDTINLAGASMLHVAAITGNARMCALLLYYGADSNSHISFEGLEISRKQFTPYRVADKGSQAEELLALLKGKLQVNNIPSSLPINMTHVAKEKLVEAMRPYVDSRVNESLTLSQETETMLRSNGLEDEEKQCKLTSTIHQLKPGQFLWFSNGVRGHGLDFVIRKSAEDNLEFAIANRGNWADQFHSKDKKGQLFLYHPKVFILNSNNTDQELKSVVDNLAQNITTTYREFNMDSFVDGPTYYERFDLSRKFPGVDELMHYGKPGLPQVWNNCTTISQWAAVDFMLPSNDQKAKEQQLQKIYKAYESKWDVSMQALIPDLSHEHLATIVSQAKAHNKPNFNLAHMLFLMAEELTNSDVERLSLYKEALETYQGVLKSGNGGIGFEGELSEKAKIFLHEHIEKCRSHIEALSSRVSCMELKQNQNHLFWFTKSNNALDSQIAKDTSKSTGNNHKDNNRPSLF